LDTGRIDVSGKLRLQVRKFLDRLWLVIEILADSGMVCLFGARLSEGRRVIGLI
jgi:hypothetical protein